MLGLEWGLILLVVFIEISMLVIEIWTIISDSSFFQTGVNHFFINLGSSLAQKLNLELKNFLKIFLRYKLMQVIFTEVLSVNALKRQLITHSRSCVNLRLVSSYPGISMRFCICHRVIVGKTQFNSSTERIVFYQFVASSSFISDLDGAWNCSFNAAYAYLVTCLNLSKSSHLH